MDKTFDARQLEAVNARNGYFLVLAPPGCGKTDILAERIAVAISDGIAPEDMICLTFTNRASRGMRERVVKRMGREGEDIVRQVFIGNLHKFCSNYIFANDVVSENSYIIDEDDQKELIVNFARDLCAHHNGTINTTAVNYIRDLASYIVQRRMGHPAEVLPPGPGLLDRESRTFMSEDFDHFYKIAEVHGFRVEEIPSEHEALVAALNYINYKESRSAIDFADLLILAYDHMRRNSGRHRYKWIQIDEVQDLNRLQLAISDLLTAPSPTAMYLGDEQQAIFSFMGAKLSNLDLLRHRCAGHILSLEANYRAPSYLLEVCNTFAERVLGVAPELLPKPKRIETPGSFDLVITDSVSPDAERERIFKMIDYYTGLSDDERMAILVSRNAQADEISETLTANGIENFKISGKDMFRSKSYKTLSSLYCVLINDFDMGSWTRLLYGLKCSATQLKTRELIHSMRKIMLTPSDLCRQQSYIRNFMDVCSAGEAVVFDTETTGLNVQEDDIVQIAAFKIRNGEKVPGSDFNIILYTDRPIPDKLGDLVNPLVAEYASRPHLSREEGLKQFLEYAGTRTLIGHNVTYDYLILRNNCARTLCEGITFSTIDTLHLAKLVNPNLKKYTLEFLISAFGLQGENAHLADADIEATLSLVNYCRRRINESGILTAQHLFLNRPDIKKMASRLGVIAPLMNNIRGYIHSPIGITDRTIADELRDTHQSLCNHNIIDPLDSKFDLFLKYIESEWNVKNPDTTLFNQISEHLYDITSTLNEGDLVNSKLEIKDELERSVRVFVMTIHKAKGLEFDNVVVLGANDGQFPYWKSTKVAASYDSTPEMKAAAEAACLEDARKLYVALSRARKRLCISFTSSNSFGYGTHMSRYLYCVQPLFHYGRKRN